jgi:Macrocin-O-methyltransferase (TylF)/Methyltransferase domain
MYPLWDQVIAPILEAAGARRVVEIGAFQGETTVKLLHLLGPDAEVHVIDPVPRFDHFEQERRFPGRYRFHGDISHNVLPTLPPMDAALIDGDHNWYTVYNELKMLAATAREADRSLPVLFLHDVGWPYGRRDLYYAPERIPEEFRQPHAQRGIRPRRGSGEPTDLLRQGGINPKLNHALREGGPRNGVMTALEDFVAVHDRGLRVLAVPIYFSLAVVAEEQRVAASPELCGALDRLESPGFLREMLELAERLRIEEMHWGQVAFFHWQDRLDRAAARYLELLRAHLGDHARLDDLRPSLETLRQEKVEGDLVECGGCGDGSIYMRGFLQAHEMRSPTVWLALDGSSGKGGAAAAPGAAGAEVSERLRRFELLDERVRIVRGGFPGALGEAPIEKVALLHLGSGAGPRQVLEPLYGRVALGGYVIVDDCASSSRRRALEGFRAEHDVHEPLELTDSGAGMWRKVH